MKTKKPGTRIIALCHIVIVEMAVASLEIKAVCPDCQSKGHVSYQPALRCCESCLAE